MITKGFKNLLVATFCTALALAAVFESHSQSHALDGQIEGTITDGNGAAVVGARVFATNTGLGVVRSSVTDTSGIYRIPLLPLGIYRVTIEAPNYKTTVRDGLTLVTGQTITLNIDLTPGEPQETVTVTADSPIADTGKTDIGRVLSNRETANVPLVSRNTLNLVLQQPNVNGRPNRSIFQFPVVSANGYRSRVNYQLDGSTATHSGRAGVRLIVIPETFVKEVQFVSNAFAPEFGNTPGVIMNMVTPSGTNDVDGSLAYFFRLPSFYSRPFGYPSAELQASRFQDVAFKIGLPLIKDRWHFYAGYEQYVKDDKGIPNRLLTISESNKAALIAAGLPASIFPAAVPNFERGRFALFRTDLQLAQNHRLAVRFNNGEVLIENAIQGGLNTLERSIDVSSSDRAIAMQVVSYSARLVNELRIQLVRRVTGNRGNEFSGFGPSIMIQNVANFGAPEDAAVPPTTEWSSQAQNNVTLISGGHVAKFGGGFAITNFAGSTNVFARYTFPSIQAYISARSGLNPRSYTRYNESSGDPQIRFASVFWNLFAQDDWKLSDRIKVTFGLRYDLYNPPNPDPTSTLPMSRKFTVDKNNLAPRLAAVYAVRQGKRPTVLRAGAGTYYETPWMDMYERALRQNGNPRYFNFSVTPDSPTAPNFPSIFPQGLQLSTQDIDTVSPDLANLYAIHANVQFEQAITANSSVAVGIVHSEGRQIAVYRSINYIPIRQLADGRPVFSRLVSPITRYDARFNNILMAESDGRSRYDALTVQFNARSISGLQMSTSYTFSKATDNAPEQNIAFPNNTNLVRSNPFDASYDFGRSFSDQRHTFVATMVARPNFEIGNTALSSILNNNQFAVIAAANSGYAFNIVSNLDLNNDNLLEDRPLGIARNSGTTPPLFNLDLRYSRFFPINETFRLELFAEFTNLFNINSIVQFSNVSVTTETDGHLIGDLPDFRARNQSVFQESRQFQLGVRFSF